jgi:hypothetical protein
MAGDNRRREYSVDIETDRTERTAELCPEVKEGLP